MERSRTWLKSTYHVALVALVQQNACLLLKARDLVHCICCLWLTMFLLCYAVLAAGARML
jgi:hypothetical protein